MCIKTVGSDVSLYSGYLVVIVVTIATCLYLWCNINSVWISIQFQRIDPGIVLYSNNTSDEIVFGSHMYIICILYVYMYIIYLMYILFFGIVTAYGLKLLCSKDC